MESQYERKSLNKAIRRLYRKYFSQIAKQYRKIYREVVERRECNSKMRIYRKRNANNAIKMTRTDTIRLYTNPEFLRISKTRISLYSSLA